MISTKSDIKPLIPCVVVVEGKTDTNKLQKLFQIQTIETNGFALSLSTQNFIQQCIQQKIPVVFLTDPDHEGTKIRNRLNALFPQQINLFLQQKDMMAGAKKIGVAECKDEVLIDLFTRKLKQINQVNNSDLTWQDLLDYNVIFNPSLKTFIINYYHLPFVNNKRLFQYLKILNVSKKELKNVVHNFSKS